MRKNGIIPPHFVFYIENDGIEIIDYKSGNMTYKDPCDRMVVKFPFSIRNIHIQVVFDKLDYSTPPDFILVNEDSIIMKYSEIIKDWNFRDSACLYNSLNKIKDLYSKEQERKLMEIIQISYINYKEINAINQNIGVYNDNPINIEQSNYNIFESIEKLIKFLKNRFNSYINVNKSNCNLEIIVNYGNYSINNSDISSSISPKEVPKNHIIISYPVDYLIRSRNINKNPMINIYIPITSDGYFYVDVMTPYYVNIPDLKYQNENGQLNNFYEYLVKYESLLLEYFREMQLRETIIKMIIDANIGFPLEIDTFAFNKLCLYFNYNKNHLNIGNSSLRVKGGNPGSSLLSYPVQYNWILSFSFIKDEYHKMEFIIIDADKTAIIYKKKFEYSANEREMNNLIHQVLQGVLELLNPVENKK
jgi:hypothetical protein